MSPLSDNGMRLLPTRLIPLSNARRRYPGHVLEVARGGDDATVALKEIKSN